MHRSKKRKASGSLASASPRTIKSNATRTTRRDMSHLPVEVLYTIFIEARSTNLPLVNRRTWRILLQAPDTVKFAYLAGLWEQHQINRVTSFKCEKEEISKIKEPSPEHDFLRDLASWRERSPHKIIICPLLPSLRCCYKHLVQRIHVYDFVLPFAVCTLPVLRRIEEHVKQFSKTDTGSPRTLRPRLPKRLFRGLRAPVFDDQALENSASKHRSPSSLAHKPIFASSDDVRLFSSQSRPFLERLGLQNAMDLSGSERIGPLPAPERLQLLCYLLDTMNAKTNSHKGFALVMSVRSRAYALINLLQSAGADRNLPTGLPLEVAIENCDVHAIGLLRARPNRDDRGTRTYRKIARFTQKHLQVAINNQLPDIIDLLWHTGSVLPDMASLRLLQQNRKQEMHWTPSTRTKTADAVDRRSNASGPVSMRALAPDDEKIYRLPESEERRAIVLDRGAGSPWASIYMMSEVYESDGSYPDGVGQIDSSDEESDHFIPPCWEYDGSLRYQIESAAIAGTLGVGSNDACTGDTDSDDVASDAYQRNRQQLDRYNSDEDNED